MKNSQKRSPMDMKASYRMHRSWAPGRIKSEDAFVRVVHAVVRVARWKKGIRTSPATKPPTWAHHATPPLDEGKNSSTEPWNSWSSNHSTMKINAGTSKKSGMNTIGTTTTTRARGNSPMKHPRTPAIAPEAPSAGTVEVGLKT